MLTPFRYCEPQTLAEVSDQLLQYAPHVRLLAGGTELLPNLERWRVMAQTVIALPPLARLRSLSGSSSAGLRIGALVTLAELAQAALVRAHWPMLAETAAQMATPAVRHLATVGGNLCGGLPAADLVAAGLALDAEVEVAGPAGVRRATLDGFLAPWGGPCLGPGECLVALHVPAPTGRAVYQRFTVRAAADIVLANVAVRLAGGDVRIVVGAHGLRPARALPAEAVLAGTNGEPAIAARAAAIAASWANPPDDARASRPYRQALIRVLVQRAIGAAAEAP